MWARIHAQLMGAKRHSLPKPVQISRPGEEPQQQGRRPATDAELARIFKTFH